MCVECGRYNRAYEAQISTDSRDEFVTVSNLLRATLHFGFLPLLRTRYGLTSAEEAKLRQILAGLEILHEHVVESLHGVDSEALTAEPG